VNQEETLALVRMLAGIPRKPNRTARCTRWRECALPSRHNGPCLCQSEAKTRGVLDDEGELRHDYKWA